MNIIVPPFVNVKVDGHIDKNPVYKHNVDKKLKNEGNQIHRFFIFRFSFTLKIVSIYFPVKILSILSSSFKTSSVSV